MRERADIGGVTRVCWIRMVKRFLGFDFREEAANSKNLIYLHQNGINMQLARGCRTYLTLPFVIFGILFFLGFITDILYICILSLPFLIAGIWMPVFFRDPELPIEKGIISPADGVVTGIEQSDAALVIRVFMNIWNIHVNRFPIDGKILSLVHKEGGHIPAFNKDAGTNERVITELETGIGEVRIVQIAGAVARRIVPYCSPGMVIKKGERMGIIRFGSRVDIHLPMDRVESVIGIGDKVRPGQRIALIRGEGGNKK